jgi:hypothetical protein
MLNPRLFHPIIYATSLLLLIAGIGVLYYFLKDNAYFYLILAGYVMLVAMFLAVKLHFVRQLFKSQQNRKTQG